MTAKTKEALDESNINPQVLDAEYAVRGAIAVKAQQYAEQMRLGEDLGFQSIIQCNIGNPQILHQKPVTFFRQVLALCDYPDLLDREESKGLFSPDAIARAREYLGRIQGGTGAYSESKGALVCREHVAKGIEKRDGHPCSTDDLWLVDGASAAVNYILQILIRNDADAVLVPIPQYPLYSASLSLLGGTMVGYYLDESSGWQCTIDKLRETVQTARDQGKCVRAITVINPGNPTGQVLDRETQEGIVRLCEEESLVLIADEVYQSNVYAEEKSFESFKKVVRDMNSKAVLLSMNSISKGFFGECGRRGGYMECVNFPEGVKQQLYKLSSIKLCPNINGQICMAMVMNPPIKGDESYDLYEQEKNGILESLKRRAKMVVESLQSLEGVSCRQVEGALYAFPRLEGLESKPQKDDEVVPADAKYCMALLDATGIVTVPGSGFGQEKGTLHVRTTILPPEEEIEETMRRWKEFHESYMMNHK
jgi:alanine transaminase